MDCIRHCASFVYMIVAYCVWHTIGMSQHLKIYVQKPILIAVLTLTLHNLESILQFQEVPCICCITKQAILMKLEN